MSIDTMTRSRLERHKPGEVREFTVEFTPEVEDRVELAWRQINEVLNTSLKRSGFPQPIVSPLQRSYRDIERLELVVVATGITVQAHEYRERYGSIDLEYYRKRMSPELFKAFVRHIGSIRGREDLDIGKFVTGLDM